MDKYQTPCIDNQEPERSTDELAQTLYNIRMYVSIARFVAACIGRNPTVAAPAHGPCVSNRAKQEKIQKQNKKLVAAMVAKQSFYNDVSAHEKAYFKYKKLRSAGGRQTERCVICCRMIAGQLLLLCVSSPALLLAKVSWP